MYAQDKGNQWYIYSGCSKHMIGYHDEFLTLKEENIDNVTFGDNASASIVGKGTISINNGKTKTHNVLYVEVLKHNDLGGYWWPPTYSKWLLFTIFSSTRSFVVICNCGFYTSGVV
jgi:hypothetical protein